MKINRNLIVLSFCVLAQYCAPVFAQPYIVGTNSPQSFYVPVFPSAETFEALGGSVETSVAGWVKVRS